MEMFSIKQKGLNSFFSKFRRDSGIDLGCAPSEAEVLLHGYTEPIVTGGKTAGDKTQSYNKNIERADTDTIGSSSEKAHLDLSGEHDQTVKVIQKKSCNEIDETVSLLPTVTNQSIFPESPNCSLILENANNARHQLNKEEPDFIVRSCQAQINGPCKCQLHHSHSYPGKDKFETSVNTEKGRTCREITTGHPDVAIINRCDTLINEIQYDSQKCIKLVEACKKTKTRFHWLVILNCVLLFCLTILESMLLILSRGNESAENNKEENILSTDKQFQICFNCSDVKQGTSLSLETLTGIAQKDGNCCFRSIVSVIESQRRNFLNTLDERLEAVKNQMAILDRRLLQLEIGSAPNTSNVIGTILQVMAPKEKTAVFLKSVKDAPFQETNDAFNKFMKLRWSTADAATIVRGNVLISEEGMNIRVTSEAYYFFYTKIQFRHEETATYKRETPMRYLVYRKTGSIPTYIHEAKLSYVCNEMSQEHSSTTEMILHLNRDDEIFIAIYDTDKQFLSTNTGAHSIGLFEI